MTALRLSACALLLCLIYASCVEETAPISTPKEQALPQPLSKASVDSATSLLRDGDLVFRRGADAISELFSRCNLKDNTFSHCGIYLINANGEGRVYHCIGGQNNPDALLRSDSVASFFDQRHNLAIGIYRYPFTKAELQQLQQVVRNAVQEGVIFDMQFDLATDHQQYCAEFVYKAVHAAVQKVVFSTTTLNKRVLVCPDNILCATSVQEVCKISSRK